MSEAQLREYGENLELNMAMSLPGVSRFRVNVFRQRGSVGMVIRRVKAEVSTLAELDLPDILKEIAMSKRGLVLVVGATGSGKSTTLAALTIVMPRNQGTSSPSKTRSNLFTGIRNLSLRSEKLDSTPIRFSPPSKTLCAKRPT
jgi:Tfp pilus assembly ATPase PilU